MFPPMWIQPACMNIEVKTLGSQASWLTSVAGAVHGPCTEHG